MIKFSVHAGFAFRGRCAKKSLIICPSKTWSATFQSEFTGNDFVLSQIIPVKWCLPIPHTALCLHSDWEWFRIRYHLIDYVELPGSEIETHQGSKGRKIPRPAGIISGGMQLGRSSERKGGDLLQICSDTSSAIRQYPVDGITLSIIRLRALQLFVEVRSWLGVMFYTSPRPLFVKDPRSTM